MSEAENVEYDSVHNGYWLGQYEKMRKERDQLRADIALWEERAKEWEGWDRLAESMQAKIVQSRATEAELRAKVERQPSVIRLAEDIIGGHSGHLPGASSSCPRCQWDAGLVALDAAEQPARAEEGPQQPAEETR